MDLNPLFTYLSSQTGRSENLHKITGRSWMRKTEDPTKRSEIGCLALNYDRLMMKMMNLLAIG